MATVSAFLDVPPADVWAVLADPETYPRWVIGCRRIRAVEGDWPAVGASFHHSFGVGPAHVNDRTTVVESEPQRRLVLDARARPFGTARVELVVEHCAGGSNVVMHERPHRPIAFRLAGPP
jgi:uncharacterized protein YndB with AHSA1/START domain